jgi:hypothetical protein
MSFKPQRASEAIPTLKVTFINKANTCGFKPQREGRS